MTVLYLTLPHHSAHPNNTGAPLPHQHTRNTLFFRSRTFLSFSTHFISTFFFGSTYFSHVCALISHTRTFSRFHIFLSHPHIYCLPISCLVESINCLVESINCLVESINCLIESINCLIESINCLVESINCLVESINKLTA